MTTDDRDVIWVAQAGREGVPETLVAFDRATRQIWFGRDRGSIGRISVPAKALVP